MEKSEKLFVAPHFPVPCSHKYHPVPKQGGRILFIVPKGDLPIVIPSPLGTSHNLPGRGFGEGFDREGGETKTLTSAS